ncbi:MAG: hypothetical protein JWP63_1747, partial [Candidatus Solibacter sp.]|nr:hypothetical protein [Candidatus Solibacter sp.]
MPIPILAGKYESRPMYEKSSSEQPRSGTFRLQRNAQ